MDISPAARGIAPNVPSIESYDQVDYAAYPYTGLPYEPVMVRRGEFFRVIAGFWADRQQSTAPPGHWNEIRSDIIDKMKLLRIPKRIGCTGPVVNGLEWEVKSMFALDGGLHDAAISTWNRKGVYDSSRPISFIRHMGQLVNQATPD